MEISNYCINKGCYTSDINHIYYHPLPIIQHLHTIDLNDIFKFKCIDWYIQRKNVRMVVLCGCTINIMIYYYYFLIFLLCLFTSTDYVYPINIPTQILFTTLFFQLSNSTSLLLLFLCFNLLYTLSPFMLRARSAYYMGSSYY